MLPFPARGETTSEAVNPMQIAELGVSRMFPPRTAVAAATTPPSTTDGRSDPLGDVLGNDGNQTVEPRADITNLALRYGPDRLDITITIPGGVDPATSPNWRGNFSSVVAVLDVNGDDTPDFASVLVSDKDGKLQVYTFGVPPTAEPRRPPPLTICGTGAYDAAARTYRISVPSACIGNAYEARIAAGILFNRATATTDAFNLTFDFVPANNDLPGVHRDTNKNGAGYRFVASDGGIFSFGNASFRGSTGDIALNQPIVGMDSTRTGSGYWLVARDGGIFTFGDAPFFGSTGDIRLNQPITAMAATPTGDGYWLLAQDGGLFTFGDATFLGSAASFGSPVPFVGMAVTPTGRGYWLATADGIIFPFGDATSFPAVRATGSPVVGIAATPSGRGLWVAQANGAVASRGDATVSGDAAFLSLSAPIVGLASTPTGRGYWLLGRDGGVFSFGDAAFHGSTGNLKLNQPVLDLSA